MVDCILHHNSTQEIVEPWIEVHLQISVSLNGFKITEKSSYQNKGAGAPYHRALVAAFFSISRSIGHSMCFSAAEHL
jgi:hypothetical protein